MTNRITPEICEYYDDDEEKLKIEVELPGVRKKDITFRLREDSFYIHAPKDTYEYTGSFAVCCPVIPEKAEAVYADGLLTVTVPYKEPMEEAVNVQIK